MAKSTKDKLGMALVAASLVIVALVLAYGATRSQTKPNAEGCIGQPSSATVIVLDHSETMSVQTREEILARTLTHVEKLPVNERVTVYRVTELSKRELEPAFSRCIPARTGNRVLEGTKGLQKKYQTTFLKPLMEVLATVPANGKESPIAQALIDISLSQALRAPSNSLLVFSDMLEHTPKFSLYRCGDVQKSIADLRESRRGAQERPKFVNTAVYLNLVPRADLSRVTLKCRDQVWAWFFGDNEGAGAAVEFDYLPGA